MSTIETILRKIGLGLDYCQFDRTIQYGLMVRTFAYIKDTLKSVIL